MRLLLVEDDLSLGEGLRTGLQAEGYTVDWLHDGTSAVHALLSETFDLVVLDLGLPRLSGIGVLQQLRKSGSHLPVLILTARDETRDRVAGLDAAPTTTWPSRSISTNSRRASVPCCAAAPAVGGHWSSTPASASTRPTSRCTIRAAR